MDENNFRQKYDSEFDDKISYIQILQEINKNLRCELDKLFKLIKMKLKYDQNQRLDRILDELEILKTSLSFAMQKQSDIVRIIYDNQKYKEESKDFHHLNKNAQNILENREKEFLSLQEMMTNIENKLKRSEMVNSELQQQLEKICSENEELRKNNNEEKTKTKNLVNLIKELEKKKSSAKVESECNILKEQVDYLNNKLQGIEGKFKLKLEKKDLIIKKLDESLSLYEEELKLIKK